MTNSKDLVAEVSAALSQSRNALFDSQIVVNPVRSRSFARIGIHGPDIVVILPAIPRTNVRPVRLSSIGVDYGVNCKIVEGGKESDEVITIIRLFSPPIRIESIFIEVVAMLLRPLARFNSSRVHEVVSGLVELFHEVNRPSQATMLGLWGELFVIGNSVDPNTVGRAWHPSPQERFDFSLEEARIEVKTTTGPRQHHFALEQVRPVPGLDIVVASVVVSGSLRGLNVVEMISWASQKVTNAEVKRHITTTALKTIGATMEEQALVRLDLDTARAGIRFFDSTMVPQPTPPKFGTSQIRFLADLQMVAPMNKSMVQAKGRLIRAASDLS